MATRWQNDSHLTHQVPAYYANNKLYKDAYTKNDVPGRTSRRIHDGLSLTANYGLDTTADDVNSSPYSSPYYINGRYNSQNSMIQRGNSASIQGMRRLTSIGDRLDDFEESDIQTTLEMWQGKQIKFELPYNGKVIGNTISIKNTMGCTGILSVYISTKEDGYPVYETAVDLCEISMDKFDHVELYSTNVIEQYANPHKTLYVRLEIWDEVDQKRSANPFNTGRKIEIAATGLGNHYAAVVRLGDKNTPVKEKYEYERLPSRPLMGLIYNDLVSIPVNRHEDMDAGATVSFNGYRYDIYAYKGENDARIAIYDWQMNKIIDSNIFVDPRSTGINIVQATMLGVNDAAYVYYVDGYSPLQYFKIGEWISKSFPVSKYEDVAVEVNLDTFKGSPLGGESGTYIFTYKAEENHWEYADEGIELSTYGLSVTKGLPADNGQITVVYNAAGSTMEADIEATYADARPVIGASLITKHNNRIYLGGFRNDPNLIQCSQIVAEGPDYSNYPYRFYVPDNSPTATSTNNVRAIISYASNTLLVMSQKSFSLFTTGSSTISSYEDAMPTQQSSYMDGAGVQSDGDVCMYGGVAYSFDPDEGIRRFSGAVWSKIPASVDTYIERVDMDKPRKLWGYARRLYLNYTDKIDGKAKCLVWDMDMNYQQYPWFQDVDIPFCDVRHDDDFDLTGIHPDYPCIMQLYADNVWRRLDTPITFERHTKHLSLPGNAADMIVSRIHNKVIANANRWWYLAVSSDKHTLEQVRQDDGWYRMPSWDTIDVKEEPESPFPELDIYESDAISLLTISNIRIRGISVQEKIKCKTFREQASLVSTLFESAVRQYN